MSSFQSYHWNDQRDASQHSRGSIWTDDHSRSSGSSLNASFRSSSLASPHAVKDPLSPAMAHLSLAEYNLPQFPVYNPAVAGSNDSGGFPEFYPSSSSSIPSILPVSSGSTSSSNIWGQQQLPRAPPGFSAPSTVIEDEDKESDNLSPRQPFQQSRRQPTIINNNKFNNASSNNSNNNRNRRGKKRNSNKSTPTSSPTMPRSSLGRAVSAEEPLSSSEAIRQLIKPSSSSASATTSSTLQPSILDMHPEGSSSGSQGGDGFPILPLHPPSLDDFSYNPDDSTSHDEDYLFLEDEDDDDDEEDSRNPYATSSSPRSKKREWLLRMNRRLSEIPVGELDPLTMPVSAIMNAWAKTKSAQGASMVELWLKRVQQEADEGNHKVAPTTKMYTMAGTFHQECAIVF